MAGQAIHGLFLMMSASGHCAPFDGYLQDTCFFGYADALTEQKPRIAACLQIENVELRDRCALSGARASTEFAQAEAFCEIITSASRLIACNNRYQELYDGPCLTDPTPEGCPLFACETALDYRSCFSEYGRKYGPQGCSVLAAPDLCYYEIARGSGRPNTCESVISETLRKSCFRDALSAAEEDIHTCLDLKEKSHRESCLSDSFHAHKEWTTEEQARYIAFLLED